MPKGKSVVFIVIAIALFHPPQPATAQVNTVAGADIVFRSRYVWRGLTRRNGWVLQPDVYLSLQQGALFLTGGWWGNIELGQANLSSSSDIGLGKTWFGEHNLWFELAGPVGPVDATLGFVRYLFAEGSPAVRLDVFDTSEVYGSLGTELGPIYPKLALWYDVDKVKGAYLEGSADLRVPTLPFPYPILSLHIGALTGWSLGHEINAESQDQDAYFGEEGLTHVDLYSLLQVGVKHFYVTFDSHFEIKSDEFTKRTSADPEDFDSKTQWWFGIAISALFP